MALDVIPRGMTDNSLAALRDAYGQWKRGKFPRSGELDLGGANVDLAHDDSHVAGLCRRFLEAGSIDPHLVIQLNATIEERLAAAARRLPEAQAEIAALREYWLRVVHLAELLGAACGAPVVSSR